MKSYNNYYKQMGLKDSKQIQKEQILARNKRQIDMMYRMFDETVTIVQDYRIKLSFES